MESAKGRQNGSPESGGRVRTTESQKKHRSVMLTVVGDDLDPDEVSDALGMTPYQSWRRGERKSFLRPDGTSKVFDTIHEQGGWKHLIPKKYKDKSLYEQVSVWLNRLRNYGEAIRSFTARGWEVELICFTANFDVLFLPNFKLHELAELGVDLSFESWSSHDIRSSEEPTNSISET